MLESGQMYLETVLILSGRSDRVRSLDIAEYMGYSKPSVSRAVHLLEDGGLITIDRGGVITLTEAGRAEAEKVYERHTVLTRLLERLGVDGQTASADACKIEHHISDTSFNAIKEYIDKLNG